MKPLDTVDRSPEPLFLSWDLVLPPARAENLGLGTRLTQMHTLLHQLWYIV